MRTKTRSQLSDLDTAHALIAKATTYLKSASEPSLALAAAALTQRLALTADAIKAHPAALEESP